MAKIKSRENQVLKRYCELTGFAPGRFRNLLKNGDPAAAIVFAASEIVQAIGEAQGVEVTQPLDLTATAPSPKRRTVRQMKDRAG